MATIDLPAHTLELAETHARRAGVTVQQWLAGTVEMRARKSFAAATLDDDWQQLHPAIFE